MDGKSTTSTLSTDKVVIFEDGPQPLQHNFLFVTTHWATTYTITHHQGWAELNEITAFYHDLDEKSLESNNNLVMGN